MTFSDRWWPVIYVFYAFVLLHAIGDANWWATALLAASMISGVLALMSHWLCRCWGRRMILPFLAAALVSRIYQVWPDRDWASRWSTVAGATVITVMGLKATIDSEAAEE